MINCPYCRAEFKTKMGLSDGLFNVQTGDSEVPLLEGFLNDADDIQVVVGESIGNINANANEVQGDSEVNGNGNGGV